MKNTLILSLALLSIASCSKPKKYCWNCQAAFTSGYQTSGTSGIKYAECDKTEDEIRQIEKDRGITCDKLP